MANLVYENEAAAITWLASGGTNAFTPTSLANAAGRQGAYYDFGVAARCRRYVWRAWLKPGATRGTIGTMVTIYWITSDGTIADNDDGTGDAAVSALNKLRNVMILGAIQIDEDAAVTMAASGDVELSARWGAPAFWNTTGQTLSTTAGDYGFSLTPVADEVQ